MKVKEVNILVLSKWDDEKDAFVSTYNADTTYDLTNKGDIKTLAVNSVNFLAKGYKIELISVRYDFITMISKYDNIYIGYTNRDGEYHEFNISDIVFPSEEYGFKYFDAFCIDEDGEPEGLERTFKIERIDFIKKSPQ
jgi:hypothetical protein